MGTIVDWIANNWQFILLIFGGEAVTLVPLVLGIVKIINKRVDQKGNNARLTAMVNAMQMLHSSLRFLQDSVELLISNVGSETMRAKYIKLKTAAEAAEEEINAMLDEFLDKKPEVLEATINKAQAAVTALKEVVSVDTNKTIL